MVYQAGEWTQKDGIKAVVFFTEDYEEDQHAATEYKKFVIDKKKQS